MNFTKSVFDYHKYNTAVFENIQYFCTLLDDFSPQAGILDNDLKMYRHVSFRKNQF